MYRLSFDSQPKSTHNSNYTSETLLEMDDLEELLGSSFTLNLKTRKYFKQKLMVCHPKYKTKNIIK